MKYYHLLLPHLLASRKKSEHAIFSYVLDQSSKLTPNFCYRFHVCTLHITRKEEQWSKQKGRKWYKKVKVMTFIFFLNRNNLWLKNKNIYQPGTSSGERIGFNKLSDSTVCKLSIKHPIILLVKSQYTKSNSVYHNWTGKRISQGIRS